MWALPHIQSLLQLISTVYWHKSWSCSWLLPQMITVVIQLHCLSFQLSQWPYIITLKNCTFWDKENLFTNIFSSNTFSSIIHPFIFLTIFFKFRVAGELKLIPAVFGWKAQGTRAQHISIMTKHSQFIGSFLCFCFVFCYTL